MTLDPGAWAEFVAAHLELCDDGDQHDIDVAMILAAFPGTRIVDGDR